MTSLLNSNTPTNISSFQQRYVGFDPSLARKLAELIQQSYTQFNHANPLSNQQQLGDWTLKSSYTSTTPLGTQEVPFGFVTYEASSKSVFVVFRGTRKFIEWFKDVNIPLVSYGTGKVEKGYGLKVVAELIQLINNPEPIENQDNFGLVALGFREIYISLRKQMIDALQKCDSTSRIFVTGHSLGGALATLAIPDILENTKFKDTQNIELYTFASPRCGDRDFAAAFQEKGVKHWRIANTEDVVTMLPFPTGNVFRPGASPETPPEEDFKTNHDGSIDEDLGRGGVAGVDKNPNPLFGFFKAMYERSGDLLFKSLKDGKEVYNRQKRRMPDYVHTGTPIYFTIHEAALERHHNLHEVYMLGIGQTKLDL